MLLTTTVRHLNMYSSLHSNSLIQKYMNMIWKRMFTAMQDSG